MASSELPTAAAKTPAGESPEAGPSPAAVSAADGATSATPAAFTPAPPPPSRDHVRESVETVVFVVVLVLLLKLFVTEAFVIPTGSMAETLYGYQKIITCPQCGYVFPVNAHDEAEGNPLTGRRTPLAGFCCPNCRYHGHIEEVDPPPSLNSGDRVLVLKPLYHLRPPRRGEVVVFKWPERPQERYTTANYIKRVMGFGGETIAIYRGDLYATTSLSYPPDERDNFGLLRYPRPDDEYDLWRPQYMYSNVDGDNPAALKLFQASRDAHFAAGRGGFEIIRKTEEQLLACRRIVWHNDYQPRDYIRQARRAAPRDAHGNEIVWWTRWYIPPEGAAAWSVDDRDAPRVFTHDHSEQHWIHYRHLKMGWKKPNGEANDPDATADFAQLAAQPPAPIDNFLAYNAGRDQDNWRGRRDLNLERLWVGDLILECNVEFAEGSEVTLELSRGVSRFRAVFSEGKVTLQRLGRGAQEFGTPQRSCRIGPGRHHLRFANVDARLWVWVDGRRVDFGPEADYLPLEPLPEDQADPEGWVPANDVAAPASIGVRGRAVIRNIVLYRDIYYTSARVFGDSSVPDVFYVQPGHYLCLGDNSAQSSDSRKWGLVPERLLIGRAVFVFWPPWPEMRIGLIK